MFHITDVSLINGSYVSSFMDYDPMAAPPHETHAVFMPSFVQMVSCFAFIYGPDPKLNLHVIPLKTSFTIEQRHGRANLSRLCCATIQCVIR